MPSKVASRADTNQVGGNFYLQPATFDNPVYVIFLWSIRNMQILVCFLSHSPVQYN